MGDESRARSNQAETGHEHSNLAFHLRYLQMSSNYMGSDPIYSESVLNAELHDPHFTRVGRDAAKRPGAQRGAWVAPVEVVEQVERFDAQLDGLRGPEGDLLGERHVHRPER